MKQKITKGKVIQSCLRATAAVVVAGGVGFQFHEIQELNKDFSTLEQSHKRTVHELEIATLKNESLSQKNSEITIASEKLSKQFSELNKAKLDLEKEKKELQLKNEGLSRDLKQARDYPRPVKTAAQNVANTSPNTPATTKTPLKEVRTTTTVAGVGTAYTANCEGCTGTTASGEKVRTGMVAMASWVPLGTKVRITCDSYPSINGVYTVSDRGGAIKGNKVDIFMESHSDAVEFGRRDIKIEVLD